MSSCDGEKMRNPESSEITIESEVEASIPHTAVKLESNDVFVCDGVGDSFPLTAAKLGSNEIFVSDGVQDSFPLTTAIKLERNDIFVSDGLYDDDSRFMEPDIQIKTEPEGDLKYSFDCDASDSEEGLQISKREVNKEEKSLKTGVKEEYGIQPGSSRKEDQGNARGKGKECLWNEEQIENSGYENPLCQESDSITHTDAGMREMSFVGGNYEEQFSGLLDPSTHMLIPTGGQLRCRLCDKTFSEQVYLEAHYETHTGKKSFDCSCCNKVFFRKSHLISHLRIHTGEKPFKCSVCEKAFSERSTLTKHLKIHTGEKPFKCSYCDKAFSHRFNLSDHNRIHTGEKPFKCSVCDKAFSQRIDYTRHCRIHTGEKPYKCNFCTKAYFRRRDLLKHNRLHAGLMAFTLIN